MEKQQTVTHREWSVMELLWESPKTLMELASALSEQMGWAKSTVTNLVFLRRAKRGAVFYATKLSVPVRV